MITASELAGFFAAHAIWCVSGSEGLIPILAYTLEDGQRQMMRLAHGDLQAAVEFGKQQLADNELDANDAVLLYDGLLPMGDEKLDAVIIEVRAYFSPASQAVFAVPYTPAAPGPFAVHKPKLLAWEGCEDFNLDACMQAFFAGVEAHEKGAAVWNECLDETK